MSWIALVVAAVLGAPPEDGNRLAYLDGHDIYYPHARFPKLITPQWVGEDGVDAVVILAIDDMREPPKYEAYLRPILQRLKAIDGRAPVSIMTCKVDPADPQLQTWLQEGLSLEIHTFDHPCPLLQGGDFAKAKGTYDKCVDLLFSVPNNAPVAFRMPCCDSLNTVSPRFYKEIFNKTTPNGKFLQISSSVFQVFTAADPTIPPELLFDADGKERFRKYFPKGLKRGDVTHDRFVNYVENYPYPYVIGGLCWEFPCMTPSDWEANFLHQPNNPKTVEDLKAALDITVHKQGVLNLVFHPHGWIKAEQVNELIDHAVAKHGKKVKFLTFKEALQRLNQNLLAGRPLRDEPGPPSGPQRVIDLNHDGFADVDNGPELRIWKPQARRFEFAPRSTALDAGVPTAFTEPEPEPRDAVFTLRRDLDGDGDVELIRGRVVRTARPADDKAGGAVECFQWDRAASKWSLLPLSMPLALPPEAVKRFPAAARFVDVNEDGRLDLVFADAEQYGVWLFASLDKGWSIELLAGKRGEKPAEQELPPIVRADGTDNGFFVRDRALHWMNEDTADRPNLIISWDFDRLLGDRLPAAKTPRAAVDSLRPRPGFQVDLMASEPMVMDPVALAWGPDGKFWVAEMADYPNGLDGRGQPGGRVRFLADTDGDGQYDRSTLFLDRVPFPNGVHPWKKGVLVSAAPDIFYAEDTDGDGQADLREVLYTGFGEGNQQHRVNGFAYGLDNWLYIANGDSGGTIKSVKSGKTVNLSGRDLRIHPASGDLEPVTGQTQFGLNRDDWGNWFGNNNSRPMYQLVLEDRYLRRNPHFAPPDPRRDVSVTPGAAPVFPASKTLTRFNDFHAANRFTSACSAIVYRDDVFTERLRASTDEGTGAGRVIGDQLMFVSEPVHNLVHCEVMTPRGTTFTSRRLPDEQQSEFLASTDNWCRPTQLRVGPDGALWIADMYRLVIEHPQWIPLEWQQKLDVRAGADQGRIWRVAPAGQRLRRIPRLDQLSPAELVAALDSPSGWQRDLVQQLLVEHADLTTVPALKTLARTCARPQARLQALCTLDGLSALDAELLTAALGDAHPGVRRHAVRLCERLPERSAALVARLVQLADDADAAVRMQLAYTLGEIPGADAATALGQLAVQDAEDVYAAAAVMSSLNAQNLAVVTASVAAAFEAGKISGNRLQPFVGQALAWEHPAALAGVLREAAEGDVRQWLPWQWGLVEQLLSAVERRGGWEKWSRSADGDLRPVVQRLNEQFARLRELVPDASAPPELRAAGVRVALATQADGAARGRMLLDWLQPAYPPAVQQAALQAVGGRGEKPVAGAILARWSGLSPALRTQALELLLGQHASQELVLAALEAKDLSPAEFTAAARQRLLDHRDAALRARAEKIFGGASSGQRAEVLARYQPTVRAGGDAQRGGEHFRKVCAQCHKLGETGYPVGPDLAALSDKSPEALLTAILDPNRAVEAKFLTYVAVTKDGKTQQGLLAAETATSVTLLAAEAKQQTLLRNDIDELSASAKSLMPEGLEKDLPPQAVADLVAFVRANVPLPQRKEFAGNAPRVVSAEADGRVRLSPQDCEIYGPTMILEERHGNLGWWSSAEDFVVWTVDVPAAGRYRVSIHWACDPQAAGHRLVVDGGVKPLIHRVEATANWDDYRTAEIGEIELQGGLQRVTFKPAARPLPALLDLKGATLTPVR